MAFSKSYIKANSLLESTVALAIISIGLSVAVKVCAMVFTNTSPVKLYENQNKLNELFYLSQTNLDSVLNFNENEYMELEIENKSDNLKKISVEYRNINQTLPTEKQFYIQSDIP